ncbi:MAG: methylated-DNA--[protein]-cysteine S-methyltransferase [Burkholderiales bacterium]
MQRPLRLRYDEVPSPIGKILVALLDDQLAALDFEGHGDRLHRLLERRFGQYVLSNERNPAGISIAIGAYFDGELNALQNTSLRSNGSPFQERAWRALRTIPPGQCATYAEQATKIGAPKAARAVGHANAQNPIAIAIPCHRVIGASRSLTGYAGGLDRKRWLLTHEGADLG